MNPIFVNIDIAAVFCRSGGFQTRPYRIPLPLGSGHRKVMVIPVFLILTSIHCRSGGFETRPYRVSCRGFARPYSGLLSFGRGSNHLTANLRS